MNSKDPQKLLKKHQIPSLDVDWLVGARNLEHNSGGNPAAATNSNTESRSRSRSRSGSTGSGDVLSNVASPQPIDRSRRYARRNSIGSSLRINKDDEAEEADADSQFTLRRTKSLSAASSDSKESGSDFRSRRRGSSISKASFAPGQAPAPAEKKVGFFKSLFGLKKSKHEAPKEANTAQRPQERERPSSRRASTSIPLISSKKSETILEDEQDNDEGVPLTRSRTASAIQDRDRHNYDTSKGFYKDDLETGRKRSPSQPDGKGRRGSTFGSSSAEDDWDPRLIEFLQYYKSKGCSVSAFQKKVEPSSRQNNSLRKPRQRTSFSIDDSMDDARKIKPPKIKVDARGRPIPEHPKKSNLRPALKGSSKLKSSSDSGSDSGSDSESSSPTTATPSSSHKFGAFLRKVTSYGATPSNSSNNTQDEVSSHSQSRSNSESFDPANATFVPGLETVKPLKYVSFATNTYFNDPPQQICSKHPRQGEVEVKPNGSVVIHRLTPEERRKLLESSSTGVVVGGSGQLKLLVQDDSQQGNDARKKEEMAPSTMSENTNKTLSAEGGEDVEDRAYQKRNIGLAAAEAAAEARGKESTDFQAKGSSSGKEDDVAFSKMATRVTIDKPMVSRRAAGENSQTSLASMVSQNSASEEEVFPPPKMKIPHDIVYTRCCHLREILPIPATMKQLKKGSTDPIPLLQLRNPRPSMIEIWSFSDFLSIAPVLCLSLDGVSLSVEMLRTILSALMFKKNFEKLSLRNTPLDYEGWKLLCYFVSKSKSLVALDLTMVPTIKTNVQKPSKSSLRNNIPRMECDFQSRKDMNWNLLAASVATKGGLEEVIISGAQMPAEQFANFIEVACIATTRLGLAYNRLTKEQCDILAKWIVQSKITGLDIGFNDLNGKLSGFINAIVDKVHNKGEKNVFKYISLNGTGLEVGPNDSSENNEVLKLISILCYFENLKFLDISNNPKMFPHCMKTVINCLPVFVNLVRLHLDYENLSSTSVVMLAEVLPLCSRLNYLSMLGTKFDLAACKSLADAVRKSSSLITLDIDYTYMPANIKEKVSLYTMRNVDNELKKVKEEGGKSEEKDQLSTLQDELSVLLTDDFKDKALYDKLVERYIERVTVARGKIKKVVKDLFDTRVKGQLSTEGKETLIRLCFIEASFEKGLRLLRDRHEAKVNSNSTIVFDHEKSDQTIPYILERTLPESDLAVKAEKEVLGEMPPASTAMSSSTFEQSGHSMLLPFSKADVEAYNPHADDAVALHEGNKESFDKISSQTREEGTTFKNASVLLGRSEASNASGEDFIGKELLGRASDSLNTDQIKDLLLKTDMSSVVNVIDELHSKGYHLHDIFNKHHCETHQKLVDLSPQTSLNDGSDQSSSSVQMAKNTNPDEKLSNPEAIPSKTGTDKSDVDEAMDAAYDQVLDSIQRDIKHE